MHKTGSTSIQRYLKSYLHNDGFHYLSLLGKSNASLSLATAFLDDPMTHPVHKKRGIDISKLKEEKIKILEQLHNVLSSKKYKNLVISAEYLSVMPKYALFRFNSLLRLYTREIIVVGYIREPKSFIESNFQQGLKFGSLNFNIDNAWPMYKNKFEKLINVFGENNVYFWLFDPNSFDKKNIIFDFLKKINYPYKTNENFLHSNYSLSLEAIKLLYIYRQLSSSKSNIGEKNLLDNNKFISKLSELKSEKFYIHSVLIKPLLLKYKNDINWIESRLNLSFASDIYKYDNIAIKNKNELTCIKYDTFVWLKTELEKYNISVNYDKKILNINEIFKLVNLLKENVI